MAAVVLRAVALGAATGGRSLTGLAAVALTTPAGAAPPWVGRLGSRVGRGLVVAGALGELLADKHPRTPSRLSPPALAGRLVLGAFSATALARRRGVSPLLPALLATAAALGGSIAGSHWRGYAGRRGSALPAAVAEDLVTALLAAIGCAGDRRDSPPGRSQGSH